MTNQVIMFTNVVYIVLIWILLVLNKIHPYQYFQIQRICCILQYISNWDRSVCHIVTIIFIWIYSDQKSSSSFDIAISVSLFQFISAIVQFVEDRKMQPFLCLGFFLLSCSILVAHSVWIVFTWQEYTLMECGFNIYVWFYELFSVFHILSIMIRYSDGRAILLSILAFKYGCRVMWVQNLHVAKQVLTKSSDKGSFIEEKIATYAWSPILSLESVNGQTWEDLKARFLVFQKYLPTTEQLSEITQTILSNQDPNIEINAQKVVEITVACFVKWIFNRDWNSEWNFVCQASWEWRKEIAVKGKADILIKRKTIDWIIELIYQSEYYELFGEQWSQPEYYSIILQPFIISPMINISDIAVAASMRPELSIYELIHYYHPFPILERYISEDTVIDTDTSSPFIIKGNTQVFIPLDQIAQSVRYDPKVWSPFGFGPRKCLGTQYAIAFLSVFLKHYLNKPNFVPQKGHRYSGRNNDNLSFRESIYQLVIIVKIFFCR